MYIYISFDKHELKLNCTEITQSIMILFNNNGSKKTRLLSRNICIRKLNFPPEKQKGLKKRMRDASITVSQMLR